MSVFILNFLISKTIFVFRILVLEGSCPEKWEEIGSSTVPSTIIQIKYHWDQVYIALANGSVIIYQRDAGKN